ncbi:hypothetical protein JMUB6875_70730 [Nocardia sp. JMUB6875]
MTTDRTAAAPVAVRNPAPAATRRLDRQARRPGHASPWAVVPSRGPVVRSAARSRVAACPRAVRRVSRRAARRAVSPLDVRGRRPSDPIIRTRPANYPIPPMPTRR